LMCIWKNKHSSNSWLLKVRSQLEFTDICSKCMVKQLLEMDTVQQWVWWIMKLKLEEQNFMTDCRMIMLALQ
jgi:hypothetical protein